MKLKFGLFSLLSRLRKDERASIPRLLGRLLRDEEGVYVMYMGFLLPVLIGASGLAAEGGLLLYNKRTLQSAADSAVYSAAISYSVDGNKANAETQAKAMVVSYGFTLGKTTNDANLDTPLTYIDKYAGSDDTAIKVHISRPQSTFFAAIYFPVLQNWVEATAIISGDLPGGNGGVCILALSPIGAPNPPKKGAGIELGGTNSINAIGCGVFSNANESNGILMDGKSNNITAASVGTVGGVQNTSGGTISPPPTSGDGAITDPYAGLTVPSPGTCLPDDTGVVKKAPTPPATTTTLSPGTYCGGGISVTNGANVTLSPGIYILNNTEPKKDAAQFIVDSQSTITGKGVTLVFNDPGGDTYQTPKDTAMNVSSGAAVDLEAPTSGTTAGMLIIGNTNIPSTSNFNLWANSATTSCPDTTAGCINGVIYLPTANFEWGGGSILTSECTQMIAYTINLQGNATFNNTGCNYPTGSGGGIKPIGSVVTLVE